MECSDCFLDLWKFLNRNGVKYILVGEFAMSFHGFEYQSGDIDLYIEDNLANRQNLRKTFQELNMGDYELIEKIQFTTEWVDFTLNNGVHLDIMTSLKGVDLSFDECLQIAPVAEIEGIMVPFLHINHLIQNKKAVNRPKDQIHVIELEKIKKTLQERET